MIERIILGRMPMMKHFTAAVELALELNDLKERRRGAAALIIYINHLTKKTSSNTHRQRAQKLA
jgi:hypothetical protein